MSIRRRVERLEEQLRHPRRPRGLDDMTDDELVEEFVRLSDLTRAEWDAMTAEEQDRWVDEQIARLAAEEDEPQ